jgi:hypothetical protein
VWQASVIKGNAGELAALAGSLEVGAVFVYPLFVERCIQVKSKGVDSVGSGFKDPCTIVRGLARKESAIPYSVGFWCCMTKIWVRMYSSFDGPGGLRFRWYIRCIVKERA